jgi:hypothetical protein
MKKIFNILKGPGLYAFIVMAGFTLNTVNYKLGYPISQIFGWAIVILGSIGIISTMIKK